jgi:hypothetical protein
MKVERLKLFVITKYNYYELYKTSVRDALRY